MNREKNKENRRNRIIKVAMELFREREYQKTTIEEIAKAAQISKPTFFAYFKSKEQILFEHDLQQLKTLELTMESQIEKNSELLNNLINAIVNMAVSVHDTHIFTQNLMHLSTINNEYRKLLTEMFIVFCNVIEKVIEFGQEQEMITLDVTPREVASDIQTIYVGILTNWVFSNGFGDLNTLMGNMLKNYLKGISL